MVQRDRKQLPPYMCPRCGFTTTFRNDIRRHFNKNRPCPAIHQNIHITEDIMMFVLDNRVLHSSRSSSSKDVEQQEIIVNEVKTRVPITERKNTVSESFYQSILERYLEGTHKKILNVGVTDVTTDTVHAEIKAWNAWKSAIGQIQAYNTAEPRTEQHIYLFGDMIPDEAKEEAVKIIKKNGIECFEFVHAKKHKLQIVNCNTKETVFDCFAFIP